MANPEHVEWLLKGAESWNKMRSTRVFRPDLSGENLSARLRDAGVVTQDGRPDLRVMILSQADLGDSDLSGASLLGSNLSEAILTKCILKDSNLSHVDFSDAKLRGTDLSGANCTAAKFRGAYLEECILDETKLGDAALAGARLTRSQPWRANLESFFSPIWTWRPNWKSSNICNVSELLQQTSALKNYYNENEQEDTTHFYFRGESNDCWDLRPKVMRTRAGGGDDTLRDGEAEMLVALQTLRAEDFVEATSALEHLVIAQHHGLPTRLLDITGNPLVALYHATREGQGSTTTGRIHVLAVPGSMVKPFSSDVVSVLTNFARLRRSEQNLLLGKTKEDTIDDVDAGVGDGQLVLENEYDLAMNRLYQFIRLERPSFADRIEPRDLLRIIVVEPRKSFERIRAQSGAFLISAFHEQFDEKAVKKPYPNSKTFHHYMFPVPCSKKATIAEELATIGITDETMFPGLDQTAKGIEKLRWDRKAQLRTRNTQN